MMALAHGRRPSATVAVAAGLMRVLITNVRGLLFSAQAALRRWRRVPNSNILRQLQGLMRRMPWTGLCLRGQTTHGYPVLPLLDGFPEASGSRSRRCCWGLHPLQVSFTLNFPLAAALLALATPSQPHAHAALGLGLRIPCSPAAFGVTDSAALMLVPLGLSCGAVAQPRGCFQLVLRALEGVTASSRTAAASSDGLGRAYEHGWTGTHHFDRVVPGNVGLALLGRS